MQKTVFVLVFFYNGRMVRMTNKTNLFIEKVKILKNNGINPKHLLFYILIGYDTTFEQDYHRFEVIRDLGSYPFIMLFNNRHDDQRLVNFARWINQRIFRWVPNFKDYSPQYRSNNSRRIKRYDAFPERKGV